MEQEDLETIAERKENSPGPAEEYKKLKLIGAVATGGIVGTAVGCAVGLIGQYIVPSVIAKLDKDSISYAIDTVKRSGSIFQSVGRASAYLSTLSVMSYIMYEQISSTIQDASDGNYTRLGVLMGTNLVSAGVEVFRTGYKMGKRHSK